VRPVGRILDVDVRTGRTRRILITRTGEFSEILQTVPGDDALITTFGPGEILTLVDTRRGTVRQRFQTCELSSPAYPSRQYRTSTGGPAWRMSLQMTRRGTIFVV
jgi:hypothetical protein